MEFQDRLKARMLELNIRPTDLSKLAGVSKATVSFWLNGTNKVSGIKLLHLADILSCSPDWLMEGKGSPGPTHEQIVEENSLERILLENLSRHGNKASQEARDALVELAGLAEQGEAPPEFWRVISGMADLIKRAPGAR